MFELDEKPDPAPRYNIAPTQPVATVAWDRNRKRRWFRRLHWGLIPAWADDPSIGNRMINARSETVAAKPAFRAAFRERRCLVVADGFYEWQKLARGKRPFLIRMRDGKPFAFAGLWEHWESPDGATIASCTILTTEPNELLMPIHNRMPVILPRCDHGRWLDPSVDKADALEPLLCPFRSGEMIAVPVSTRVNNPSFDDPACIDPIGQ